MAAVAKCGAGRNHNGQAIVSRRPFSARRIEDDTVCEGGCTAQAQIDIGLTKEIDVSQAPVINQRTDYAAGTLPRTAEAPYQPGFKRGGRHFTGSRANPAKDRLGGRHIASAVGSVHH